MDTPMFDFVADIDKQAKADGMREFRERMIREYWPEGWEPKIGDYVETIGIIAQRETALILENGEECWTDYVYMMRLRVIERRAEKHESLCVVDYQDPKWHDNGTRLIVSDDNIRPGNGWVPGCMLDELGLDEDYNPIPGGPVFKLRA